MIALSGARLVTPTALLDPGTLVIEGEWILDVQTGRHPADHELERHTIVPGFVDVHVHGLEGIDALGAPEAVDRIARALPKYGVTAFCPTAIACAPAALHTLFSAIASARRNPHPEAARVLPAHLESNFINPEYCGAQPRDQLRLPPDPDRSEDHADAFTGAEVLREIDAAREEVGILTLAPELPHALALIRTLADAGHRVSLGHSGATFEEGLAGIDAGARHATHLFNRMPPFSHREPGLVGAILDRTEVMAELIVDGHHVHPATGRAALRVLGQERAIAITDGTAVAGMPPGTVAQLGSRSITAGNDVALLSDGTWAGSILTMDVAFRNAVRVYGCGLVEAALMCSTNPARAIGAPFGALAPGSPADFVILGPNLEVVQTFIAGLPVLEKRRGARL
jgi:N-acetylglucosamine-6-phosphate deacetylase